MGTIASYRQRVIDDELTELIAGLPAIAIEGPKGVGKTRTALQYARTVHRLDDPAELAVAQADPALLLDGEAPVLIDEWQRMPEVWDLLKRRVDDGAPPGSFLLTGSAIPGADTHSGAARIVSVRMRPFALSERPDSAPTVSLAELLRGGRPPVAGDTQLTVGDYAEEVLASGLPAVRGLPDRARRRALDSYVDRVVDRRILLAETGVNIRNPTRLRAWMTAYAAASSSTTSYEKMRDAANAGQDRPPSQEAAHEYRDALKRIWMLDEVPAWIPANNPLKELSQSPKHQLADPALAAQLLGANRSTLLQGRGAVLAAGNEQSNDGDRTLLAALFESLVALSVRVYAQHSEARIGHFRTHGGRQEVDLIVENPDGGVVAIEVKLARTVRSGDCNHLHRLGEQLGQRLLDQVVITTGPRAYRRKDGIAIVPAALLGP